VFLEPSEASGMPPTYLWVMTVLPGRSEVRGWSPQNLDFERRNPKE
jgi:hypothetical protein